MRTGLSLTSCQLINHPPSTVYIRAKYGDSKRSPHPFYDIIFDTAEVIRGTFESIVVCGVIAIVKRNLSMNIDSVGIHCGYQKKKKKQQYGESYSWNILWNEYCKWMYWSNASLTLPSSSSKWVAEVGGNRKERLLPGKPVNWRCDAALAGAGIKDIISD